MNQDAEKLRGILLEADLQLRLDIVHTGQGKIIRQGAVAGDEKAVADALKNEFVDVEYLGKLRGHGPEAMFKFGVP